MAGRATDADAEVERDFEPDGCGGSLVDKVKRDVQANSNQTASLSL
jgi:hypothetical protein